MEKSMSEHVAVIPDRKPARGTVGLNAPVRQAMKMLLSLAVLTCFAVLPAQAAEVDVDAAPNSGSTLPNAQPTVWVGVAVSTNGRVFFQSTGGTELNTRYSVRSECENTVDRTCQAIAVPSGWEVVGLSCQGHGSMGGYVGGSGLGAAEDVAYDRASRAGFDASECTKVYRRP